MRWVAIFASTMAGSARWRATSSSSARSSTARTSSCPSASSVCPHRRTSWPAPGWHRRFPLLKQQPGSKVVNIASVEVFRHSRKLSAYAASKGALASLSRSLALELAPHAIHVNYICPGFIRTEMTRRYADRWLTRKIVEHRTPLGRMGEPEDVARVALFLASPDSDFVTGEGIVVDGGLTLRGV